MGEVEKCLGSLELKGHLGNFEPAGEEIMEAELEKSWIIDI